MFFILDGYCGFLLFRCRRCLFPRRKVQFQYGVGGTDRHALAAEPALVIIYEGQVIFNGDGFEGADLLAFGAPDAGDVACFFGDGSLILVHTAHVDAA